MSEELQDKIDKMEALIEKIIFVERRSEAQEMLVNPNEHKVSWASSIEKQLNEIRAEGFNL
jgi:hypothetical protein